MTTALRRAWAGASTDIRLVADDDVSYAGPDRRAGVAAVPISTREFVLAGSILVVLTMPFALTGGRGPLPRTFDAPALNGALGAMTALLAVIVGSVSIVRWRLIGEATSLRVGVGAILLGVAGALEVGGLVAPGLAPHSFPIGLAPAFCIAGLFALAVALVAPEVDDRVGLWHVTAFALVWTAAAALLLEVGPALDTPFGAPRPVGGTTGGPTPVRLAILVMLTVLATAYTLRGLQRRRWLHTWIGLMLFGLALSTALAALAYAPGDVRLTGAEVLALFGLAFAANGSARELAAAYKDQRARLFDTEMRAETSEIRSRAERAAREEQTHDVQSVLLSVQAALRTLERDSTTLDHEQRKTLAEALDAELARVRDLLTVDPVGLDPRPFPVADAVTPLAVCRSSAGADVRVAIPADLHVFGHPKVVAEIVDNLVSNALRHAPGSPVFIAARGVGPAIEVRVEDSGPGIASADREAVFDRGRHSGAGGSGLGLYVARRLARHEGGDLWADDSPHGGVALVLLLPAARASRLPVESSSMLTMSDPSYRGTLVADGLRAETGGARGSAVRHRAPGRV